ncbi:hypothetical protein ES703_78955 [subsurface metagenome]
MILTDEQKRMYEGEYGPGIQKAMSMLVEYGNVWDAERMVRVSRGHIGLWSELEWIEKMLEGVEQIRIPLATIHPGYPTASRLGRAMGLREESCQREAKALNEKVDLLVSKGCVPTMSCTTFLVGNVPTPGSVFSWPGSMGIVVANSVFGAKGNRDTFTAALASAITGVTPDMLLLKRENRYGQVLVRLENLNPESFTLADYGALGYYIGGIAKFKNVVIDGVPDTVSLDELKCLLSPMPVSGAVGMCHIVGVTPEAPTVEEALGHKKPEETIKVGKKELGESWESLHTATKDDVELVLLGCPHASITEIGKIARLLEHKKKADSVRLFVSTAEQIYTVAKRMGYVDIIEQAGGLVITDSCIALFPCSELEPPATSTATNSAKAASYLARAGTAIQYGSVERCINAAITGKFGG